MFTAIYVYSSTSISISTAESNLDIDRFGGESKKLISAESLSLGPGIYTVRSADPLSVSYSPGPSIEIVTSQHKNDVPPPKPQLQTVPSGSNATTFDQAFGDYLDVRG